MKVSTFTFIVIDIYFNNIYIILICQKNLLINSNFDLGDLRTKYFSRVLGGIKRVV